MQEAVFSQREVHMGQHPAMSYMKSRELRDFKPFYNIVLWLEHKAS